MKFLSSILILGGYILVYAAIAKRGRFAQQPWMGLFHDAYGVDEKQKNTGGGITSSTGQPKGPYDVPVPSPVRPRTPNVA